MTRPGAAHRQCIDPHGSSLPLHPAEVQPGGCWAPLSGPVSRPYGEEPPRTPHRCCGLLSKAPKKTGCVARLGAPDVTRQKWRSGAEAKVQGAHGWWRQRARNWDTSASLGVPPGPTLVLGSSPILTQLHLQGSPRAPGFSGIARSPVTGFPGGRVSPLPTRSPIRWRHRHGDRSLASALGKAGGAPWRPG